MRSHLWEQSDSRIHGRTTYVVAALAAASVAVHLLIPSIGWAGSGVAHSGAEVVAGVLAAIVGVTLISISVAVKERWLKILGIGLVIAAGFDLIHAIASSPSAVDSVDNGSDMIGWTSLLSRFALAGFSLCAVLAMDKQKTAHGLAWWSVIPLRAIFMVAVTLAGTAIVVMFAGEGLRANEAEQLASYLPGITFLVAFLIIGRRKTQFVSVFSAFAVFLFASGISDAAFMPYTRITFDGYFSASHGFKLLSYTVILVGILSESQHMYRVESAARRQLGAANESLNEANLLLTTVTNDLQALNRIGQIAGASRSVSERFNDIGEIISHRIRVDRLLIATVNTAATECRIEAVFGESMPHRGPGDLLPLAGSLTGRVVKDKKTYVFDDVTIEGPIQRDIRLADDLKAGFRSWISTPVMAEDEVVGALMVRSKHPDAYGDREAQFLEQVASQLAGAVRLRRLLVDPAA